MSKLVVLTCLLVIVIAACSGGGTPAPNAVPSNTAVAATTAGTLAVTAAAAACPQIVQKALQTITDRCNNIGSNQVCYGNPRVEVTTANNAIRFKAPGDTAKLGDLKTLRTLPLDEKTGTWGIAVMRAAVNLPGTTAGQQVTFLMYGDTTLDSFDAAMKTISFRTAVGPQACDQVPPSGLTVQVPKGLQVKFTANGADISLGSTIVLQSDPDKEMVVRVLEGQSEVLSRGVNQVVHAGLEVQVPMRAGVADGPPSAPKPILFSEVRSVPGQILSEPITVRQVATAIDIASTQIVQTITPRPTSATSTPGTPQATITPILTWTPGPTLPPLSGARNRIAFSTNRDGNWEIYVMNADGTSPVRLTTHDGDDKSPVWSPDGRQIAFASYTGQTWQIFIMSDDARTMNPLTQGDMSAEHPSWSPDGKLIAYDALKANNRDIWVSDTNGNNAHPLASDPADDSQPAWSADGKRIAFVSMRSGNKEIYVMDADGSNLTRLTTNPADDTSPAWSPDGKRIAFVSNRGGNNDIYVMNADGSNVQRLVSSPADDTSPAWSPDGSQLLFTSNREGTQAIYVINVAGQPNSRRLTDLTADSDNPAWQR